VPSIGTTETILQENSNHEVLVPAIRRRFRHRLHSAFPFTTKFLQSRGVQTEAAPDLAQAAWVRGWECRRQLRSDSALRTWVNTVAWNLFREVTNQTPPTIALTNLNVASHDLRVEPKILAQELLRHPWQSSGGSATQNRKAPPIIHYEGQWRRSDHIDSSDSRRPLAFALKASYFIS